MSERSLGIDILRIFSIMLVVGSHYNLTDGFLLGGTHGVVIFFMVSGYCMHYSLAQRTGGEFLSARFWRLIPALVLCATVTSLVKWSFPDIHPERMHHTKSYLATLLCLPSGNLICDAVFGAIGLKPFHYSWVDGAYWSLLVEIRFYLVLWVLVYLLKARHPSLILSFLGLLAPFNLSLPFLSKSQDFLLYLDFFAFGLAYRAWVDKERYAALFMSIAVLVFLSNAYFGSVGLSMNLNHKNVFSYFLCFPIFLAVMMLFRKKMNRPVSALGVLTYPFYLLHQDIGLVLIALLSPIMSHGAAAFAAFAVVLALSAGAQAFLDGHIKAVRASVSDFVSRRLRAPMSISEGEGHL